MTSDTALQRTSAVDPELAAAMQISDRLTTLKDALGIKDLSEQEVQLFAMVAQRSRLDPFAKQIYAIKRAGKVSYQTGIDGYRSIAARTGEYAGSDEATFEECPCGELPKPHPAVARVTVHRIHSSGRMLDQVGVARWHELKPAAGQYAADARWIQMPYNQLAKCAEANGLRKMFPSVLADIYVEDEMDQSGVAENGALVRAATAPKPADRLAARRAVIEGTVVDPEPQETPKQGQPFSVGSEGLTVVPTAPIPADTPQDEAADSAETPVADATAASAASSDPEGYRAFALRLNSTAAAARPSRADILKKALAMHKDIPSLGLIEMPEWPFLPGAWGDLADALELAKVSE